MYRYWERPAWHTIKSLEGLSTSGLPACLTESIDLCSTKLCCARLFCLFPLRARRNLSPVLIQHSPHWSHPLTMTPLVPAHYICRAWTQTISAPRPSRVPAVRGALPASFIATLPASWIRRVEPRASPSPARQVDCLRSCPLLALLSYWHPCKSPHPSSLSHVLRTLIVPCGTAVRHPPYHIALSTAVCSHVLPFRLKLHRHVCRCTAHRIRPQRIPQHWYMTFKFNI